MDADGDVDLLAGHYYDRLWYYENTAGPGVPTVLAPYVTLLNYLFGGGGFFDNPTAVDWDHDGDLDLVVGAYNKGVRVFWNNGDPTSPSFSTGSYQELIAPTGYTYTYPCPAHVDWDNDGDWDLVVGNYDGFVNLYRNESGTLVDEGALSTTSGRLDVGSNAAPEVVDWDNDGTYDLVVGEYYGAVYLFRNGPPVSVNLDGAISGGALTLTWDAVPGAAYYWIYGADNLAYFEPGLTAPWQYRRGSVPAGSTTWSSPSGIGDPDHNWTYQIIALDASLQDISRSNRFGAHDFSTGTGP
jgi:hypothetical protein